MILMDQSNTSEMNDLVGKFLEQETRAATEPINLTHESVL